MSNTRFDEGRLMQVLVSPLVSEKATFVAEKTNAADVCIFQPPAEALQIGQKQLDICIERYQECQRTNQWPGYGSGLLDLEVSYFDRRKYLN